MQYMNVYVRNIACRSVYLISQAVEQMSVKYDLKESKQVI